MVAVLLFCGLRRAELLAVTMKSSQQREHHWVIADPVGKGGHVGTVPIPAWVKSAIDNWTREAGHHRGPRVPGDQPREGLVWGERMTSKVIWEVVKGAAKRAGIEERNGGGELRSQTKPIVAPNTAQNEPRTRFCPNTIKYVIMSGTHGQRPRS